MRGPTYRYNEKTCRYERFNVSFRNIFIYSVALTISATLILAALLILHDFIIDSESENLYRKENAALEKHEIILTAQLNNVEAMLTSLTEKDKGLHKKFFYSAPESDPITTSDQEKRKILFADASTFTEIINSLNQHSGELINRSQKSQNILTNVIRERENHNDIIPSIPILLPIEDLEADKILSGFGMRINPFHKGLYDHAGIDIAIPRGTDVLATATGEVITTKYSSLQAGFGNYIEIDHGNGFVTRYTHLEEIRVRTGEKVEKGFIIASSGNSGGCVAPLLHYEIIRNGKNVDPIMYMIKGVTTQQHELLKKASQIENQSLD